MPGVKPRMWKGINTPLRPRHLRYMAETAPVMRSLIARTKRKLRIQQIAKRKREVST
jgi:hypothetical protein